MHKFPIFDTFDCLNHSGHQIRGVFYKGKGGGGGVPISSWVHINYEIEDLIEFYLVEKINIAFGRKMRLLFMYIIKIVLSHSLLTRDFFLLHIFMYDVHTYIIRVRTLIFFIR